jgi:uncharacterized membrane protein
VKILIAGLIIFFGIHLLPTFSSFRQHLINRLGLYPYKGLFALIALLGLALIIHGHLRAPSLPLWTPPAWGRYAVHIVMLPAAVLFAAAYLPGNIKRYTRHPMLWGATLWAIGHILANGELASLIIFVGIGLFALFDMVSANRRGATFSEVRKSVLWDALVIVVGLITYVAILTIHPSSSTLKSIGPDYPGLSE